MEQAIEGVALIRKQIPNLELYLVGRIDFFANRLKSVVKAKGYSDWVKFLGQVTDDELSGLYHNCQAYLFLSLQEGFGLGPLEAASNEALIIASDIPVLHEILTDGAIFTDRKNTQQIAQAIISSFIPATKEKTMAAARQTLKRYSWPDTVNKTLKVYHETIVR